MSTMIINNKFKYKERTQQSVLCFGKVANLIKTCCRVFLYLYCYAIHCFIVHLNMNLNMYDFLCSLMQKLHDILMEFE
jgi:hypothetical protein